MIEALHAAPFVRFMKETDPCELSDSMRKSQSRKNRSHSKAAPPFPIGKLLSVPQTFHSIPCLDVHVDAMDVAGDNHLEMDHDMWKQRLGPDGSAIGEAFTEVVSFSFKSLLQLSQSKC